MRKKEPYRERKEYYRKYEKTRPPRDRKQSDRDYRLKPRLKFLEMYGGKCECCGESILEFLAIDHVKGTKREHNFRYYQAYNDAIKNYNPEEYRILCHNCNMATRYGKICPHKLVNCRV